MANFLGKLKDIIGGNPDYQYYEQEIEEIATKDFTDSALPELESTPAPEVNLEPQADSLSSSDHHREKSKFSVPLPSEPTMDDTNNTSNLPSNVIGMPGINTAMNEVVVIEAHSFDEIPQVIQTLREQRCVVLNLNVMDPDEAQRAVDFVAGGTYAIDGHQERIGESIFLFTPRSVRVNNISGDSSPGKTDFVSDQTISSSFVESLWDETSTDIPTSMAQ